MDSGEAFPLPCPQKKESQAFGGQWEGRFHFFFSLLCHALDEGLANFLYEARQQTLKTLQPIWSLFQLLNSAVVIGQQPQTTVNECAWLCFNKSLFKTIDSRATFGPQALVC